MKIFQVIVMGFELLEHSRVGLIVGLTASVLMALVFFTAKQVLQDPQRKYMKDKALLKELLEGFGLDIPAELNDSEGRVLRPIKKN